MKKALFFASIILIVLTIMLLIIIVTKKGSESASQVYDKELTNHKINTAIQVFVADPIFERYSNDRTLYIRKYQSIKRFVFYNSISLDLVEIVKCKGCLFPFKMIIYNGSNNFYHVFPLMDNDDYYNSNNILSMANDRCKDFISELLYRNISLEKHLNFIFNQDDFFNRKDDKYRKLKQKMFLKLVFKKILNCKEIPKCNYKLLQQNFEENKNYFKHFDFELIKSNYKRIEKNLCSSDMMYFIKMKSVYEVDLYDDYVKIELLNKELFYWPDF
jgi:hypothetical protein